jgi:hypothetical protein
MSDAQYQNLLSALTDAMLADGELDTLTVQYDLPAGEVNAFINLIRQLHGVFAPVEPSRRFTQRLKGDLMGTHRQGVVARVRYLPARVQITAIIALLAGVFLFAHRHLAHLDSSPEGQEAPALQ